LDGVGHGGASAPDWKHGQHYTPRRPAIQHASTDFSAPRLHQFRVIDRPRFSGVRFPKGAAMNIKPTKKKTTTVDESEELKDKIRRRAYQLYEERLWEDGHELEDWLRAEEEMMEQGVRPKAA
jgi:hypothetical protein